jgi:hydroxyacylglutathione hydrolase
MPPRPEYFGRDVELNRQGATAINQIPPPAPVRAPEVARLQAEGAIVLDTRPAMQFAVAHVPGSVHIGLSGQYASWAARILGLDKRIILAGEDADHLRESQLRLARVGIENVHAYLEDGIAGWIGGGYELDYIPQITVQEFTELKAKERDHIAVLDVREPGEVALGAIENSVRIPLGSLAGRTNELDPAKLIVVHCQGGYRSSIATSILRRAGFRDIANLTGGFDAWKAMSAEVGSRAG